MTPLNVAVIGTGHLGKFHARLLAGMPEVCLVGVADPVAATRDAVAAECKTRAFADYRDLVGQIDAAVIATPTRFHHAVALSLLERGIHLLVEKPITTTLAEADELIAAAERRRLVLQVGHIERFNPALAGVLPHVHQPKYIEAARYGGYTFRSTDIGVVLDLMIHDIDLTLSLAGAAVERVEALGLAVLGEHEDAAQARLTFANGCVANLSASRVSYKQLRQMQIWSRGLYANVDFNTRAATLIRPATVVAQREFRGDALPPEQKNHLKEHLFETLLPSEQLAAEPRNAMLDELHDFADSIRNLRQPRVTGQQGRDALAVAQQILAAIEAHAWEGDAAGPRGSLATPPAQILRGPHWDRQAAPARHKDAG